MMQAGYVQHWLKQNHQPKNARCSFQPLQPVLLFHKTHLGPNGTQPITIRTGYTYGAVYGGPVRFGDPGTGRITGVLARREITLWQTWQDVIGTWDARSAGLGGWALTESVRRAWASGTKRVWVHTCDLDHPTALANYLARGFRVFQTEKKVEDLPPQTPGPWTGCGETGRPVAKLPLG